MVRVLRPGGRLGVFDITTSEVTEESDYHNVVERLRDPSHTPRCRFRSSCNCSASSDFRSTRSKQSSTTWTSRTGSPARSSLPMTATRGGVDRRGDWDAEVWRQEGVARRRRKALLQRAVGDPRGDEAGVARPDTRALRPGYPAGPIATIRFAAAARRRPCARSGWADPRRGAARPASG
jgi:hypothetical protein